MALVWEVQEATYCPFLRSSSLELLGYRNKRLLAPLRVNNRCPLELLIEVMSLGLSMKEGIGIGLNSPLGKVKRLNSGYQLLVESLIVKEDTEWVRFVVMLLL